MSSNLKKLLILRVKRKRNEDPLDGFANLPECFKIFETVSASEYDKGIRSNVKNLLVNKDVDVFNYNKEIIKNQNEMFLFENNYDIYDAHMSDLVPKIQSNTSEPNYSGHFTAKKPELFNEISSLIKPLRSTVITNVKTDASINHNEIKNSDDDEDEDYVYDLYYGAKQPIASQEDIFDNNAKVATLFWDTNHNIFANDADDDSDEYQSDDSNAENYFANDYPDEYSGSDFNSDSSDYGGGSSSDNDTSAWDY
ncbi:hypothetical protein AYI69_g10114 [Smittium culicis]|uniref:Probable RNA polymerase II nuclear localization protein SLC7A6OS n=1 Tax=Smittium culicis TaxID=133412 RepID=A0A1R1X818_9FUNG|nr:hypothetical protein AYI69_g10114 [Smittium culicis]